MKSVFFRRALQFGCVAVSFKVEVCSLLPSFRNVSYKFHMSPGEKKSRPD
jgi:hypothetical protein